jgi:23S rRNA pseudouridine2605 synthase
MAKKKTKLQPESTTPESTIPDSTEPNASAASESEIPKPVIEDPIGDVTDGEAAAAIDAEPDSESEIEAEDAQEPESDDSAEPQDDAEPEIASKPRPPAKLERLQKILAAAGVASRRSAEAMIEQGRVQINGKVVTVLGTKADAGCDHIRVDGKLLQGPERLRYFVLNKPRGFVTTVKDPEGRPTVMQFFDKMKERLYPVGRLDYMSEGLLVVTNDGELANRLTKASSGVEKTYLVKVAGQPTEAELDILRGGVAIERGKPGSPQVRTSPARIRQVRQGDNPWYEVVLIEGRNRELRKMFEEVGHFVEKIRRVGYGPLVLDQEPGNLRELEPEELEKLRLAAEGKLRTPKSKDLRRRNLLDAGVLPTVLPKPSSRARLAPPSAPTPAADRPAAFSPKKFGPTRPIRSTRPADSFARGDANKFFRPSQPSSEGFRPAAGRTSAPNPVRSFSRSEEERPPRAGMGRPANFGSARPAGRSFDKPAYDRPSPDRPSYDRANVGAPRPDSAATSRTGGAAGRPFPAKPAWKKPDRTERSSRPERPAFQRAAAPVRQARDFDEDLGPVRPPNLHIEEIQGSDRPSPSRPSPSRPFQSRSGAPRSSSPRPATSRPSASRTGPDRTGPDRPSPDRPSPGRPIFDRSGADRPRPSRPGFERPASSARPSAAKPFRSEGGLARPFTTSSGKPRPGGARPSSKHGAPADRSSSVGRKPGKFSKPGSSKPGAFKSYGSKPAGRPSAGPAQRPFTPRTEGVSDYRPTKAKPYPKSASRAERKTGPGWKPKPNFATGKPSGSSRSKPKPGSSAKPSHRPKPGGKRPGSKPSGKKRG